MYKQCCRYGHCCFIWRHFQTHCRPTLYHTKWAEASLDLVTRWRCGVIMATPRPLYPREQHWYPLLHESRSDTNLDGCGEKKIVSRAAIWTPNILAHCESLSARALLYMCIYRSWSNPITGLERSWGFQEVEGPRFQDNRHMKVVRLSVLHTGRLYPTRKYSWYSFLLEAESTPGP